MIPHFNPTTVSVKWLKANLTNPRLVILDGTINKIIQPNVKRIPTARFFDLKQKFSNCPSPFPNTLPSADQFQKQAQALGIKKDTVIVVYDDKGIYSSARVWWLFKTFGFHTVAVLNGGLPEWIHHNFELENYVDEVYNGGNLTTDVNSELMTNFNGICQLSKNNNALILDARSSDRFKGLVDEPREGLRRGSIPNSKNLPYTTLFKGNTLKSKPELLKIFGTLIKNETLLVFSCGSGITACILALAATICNYKHLIVYDGSWTEYGTLIP